MGISKRFQRGKSIVTDGLVLALDAANTKSYSSGSIVINDLIGDHTFNIPQQTIDFNSPTSVNVASSGDQISGSSLIIPTEHTFLTNIQLATENFNPIFSGGVGTAQGDGFYFTIDNRSSNYYIYIYAGGLGFSQVIPADNLFIPVLDTWYQVGYSIGGGTLDFIVNGESIYSVSRTVTSPGTFDYITLMGRNYFSPTKSNGKFNQAMFYNRKLSPSEILQNYNATKGRFGL